MVVEETRFAGEDLLQAMLVAGATDREATGLWSSDDHAIDFGDGQGIFGFDTDRVDWGDGGSAEPAGEPGLSGVTIYLDMNDNGVMDVVDANETFQLLIETENVSSVIEGRSGPGEDGRL